MTRAGSTPRSHSHVPLGLSGHALRPCVVHLPGPRALFPSGITPSALCGAPRFGTTWSLLRQGPSPPMCCSYNILLICEVGTLHLSPRTLE